MITAGYGNSGILISGVYVFNGPGAGMIFLNCNNYSVESCDITGTLADGIHNTRGSSKFTISNNRIYSVADDAIALVSYNDGLYDQVHDWVVTGNLCLSGSSRGVACIGSAKGVISSNRVLSGCALSIGVAIYYVLLIIIF